MGSLASSRSIPQSRRAIVCQDVGKLEIQNDRPMPVLEPETAIVKVLAVGLNPHDIKGLDYSAAPGAVHGGDFCGIIVALGEKAAAEGRFAVGDRVAGLVQGENKLAVEKGAFADYIEVTPHTMVKVPDTMGDEEAATLGVGIATSTFGLYRELKIPGGMPRLDGGGGDLAEEDREFVFVAGGSTATGTRTLQLLKLAGFRSIATASPGNFDLCLRYGAEKVFDYRSPTCAADIRAYTSNELEYAFDCIAEAETTQLCYGAIGRAGGRYVTLEPFRDSVVKARSLTIEPSWFMATQIFGEDIAMDGVYARTANLEDRAFGTEAFHVFQTLLDRGLVSSHPVKSMPGGWEGVMKGVTSMRSAPPSGFKLAYKV
ncbi:GroES-like protein [Xylariomycetidae sp. FL2044]|nr:GroES-like protein [Xylariomycetidae sp. FL2044]